MKKFRLSLVRQKAEGIVQEKEFRSFPIDPFKIAEQEDILVQAKPPDVKGMSGCIIFNSDSVGIIHASNIKNEGFVNFTIAHELGHYFIEGHPEEIMKTSAMHLSRSNFTRGDISIEIEADHFASSLLMPSRLTRNLLTESQIGLEGIKCLQSAARSSLTSAAIRAAECSSFPVSIIVSKGDEVSYCFMSDSFKQLGRLSFLAKGKKLPPSATLEFNKNKDNVAMARERCDKTSLFNWFGETKAIDLDEEIIGLGEYGYTLTVLSSEELAISDEEDEDFEEKLIESWKPRFSYKK